MESETDESASSKPIHRIDAVNLNRTREKLTTAPDQPGDAVNFCENKNKLTTKLSDQQKQILVYLYRGVRAREDHFLGGRKGEDPGSKYAGPNKWGGSRYMTAGGGGGCRPSIDWQLEAFLNRKPSASEKSSFSRSVRRLHDSGLLVKDSKIVGVCDAGRVTAVEILGESDPYPTEADYQLAFFPGMTIAEILANRERRMAEFSASFNLKGGAR